MRYAWVVLALVTGFSRQLPAIDVRFVTPATGDGVFGATPVEVAVQGGTADRVEIFLAGTAGDRRVARLDRAPWRVVVDTGQENVERTLRAVALTNGGESAEATLVLNRLHVDEVIDLSLRQLYVTVTRDGEPWSGLQREDFHIVDSGATQSIVTFEGGDAPLTAVIAIDASRSMRGAPLASAIDGARAFAERMLEFDEASLLLFSDRIVHRTPFTGDSAALVAGISGAVASGGSAVNDHLFLALESIERRQGRRVVILLSDGIDVESLLGAGGVAQVSARGQAIVYWIRPSAKPIDGRRHSGWRDVDSHASEIGALAAMVDASGGRRIEVDGIEGVTAAFVEILDELRSQYVIGYYPDNLQNNGGWHPLRVDVRRNGARVRTRGGYHEDP